MEVQFALQISTHTSLAGRDQALVDIGKAMPISTHTSLAGRDSITANIINIIIISTHTSLAGRDNTGWTGRGDPVRFLLTRPSRDVTIKGTMVYAYDAISTHTSLAGRDIHGR